MGRSRTELHEVLKDLLGSDNVYFQPPPNIQMAYPCIVYQRDSSQTVFADDNPYSYTQRYQVMVIDRDPDSDIPAKLAALPMCLFVRFYTADNLNHDVFNLFF